MVEEGKKDSNTHSLTKTHRLACHSLIFLKSVDWISFRMSQEQACISRAAVHML